MLGWLLGKMNRSYALRQLRKDELIRFASVVIGNVWGNKEISQGFTSGFMQQQRAKMMEQAIFISQAPDRRMANRELLAGCVLEYAKFQVLILPPESELAEPTELRGKPGITGELKPHLLELARQDKYLREFMHSFGDFSTWDDVWDVVLLRYRVCWAWAQFHQALRFTLNDVNQAPGKDWYRPFVAAMCAWEEHNFREVLGMPSALGEDGEDAGIVALAYSTFLNRVTSGDQYPNLTWQEMVGSIVKKNFHTAENYMDEVDRRCEAREAAAREAASD
jgi:hypothetical protein